MKRSEAADMNPAATAAAKLLQSCLTLCNPTRGWMASHQAPPSLGFSRQEHWRGLPFPSPLVLRSTLIKNMYYASFFVDVNKLILKFVWKVSRPRIANEYWRTFSRYTTQFQGLLPTTVYQWCAFNERTETQVSGIKWCPEINQDKYCQMVLDKGN